MYTEVVAKLNYDNAIEEVHRGLRFSVIMDTKISAPKLIPNNSLGARVLMICRNNIKNVPEHSKLNCKELYFYLLF